MARGEDVTVKQAIGGVISCVDAKTQPFQFNCCGQRPLLNEHVVIRAVRSAMVRGIDGSRLIALTSPAAGTGDRIVPRLKAHGRLHVVVPRAQPVVAVARAAHAVRIETRDVGIMETACTLNEDRTKDGSIMEAAAALCECRPLGCWNVCGGYVRYQLNGHQSLVGHELASSSVQEPQWQFSIS